MKKLIAASPIQALLAGALMLTGAAQADVSDFASSSQTTDRTSASELESDSDQYYASSTDVSETYSGDASGSSATQTGAALSRRAVPVTDFSGYRTLGSASIVDADATPGNQSGSAFNQSINQVPNPSVDTSASRGLGYGINQGNFTPNAGLPSSAPATGGSSMSSGGTATITAP